MNDIGVSWAQPHTKQKNKQTNKNMRQRTVRLRQWSAGEAGMVKTLAVSPGIASSVVPRHVAFLRVTFVVVLIT